MSLLETLKSFSEKYIFKVIDVENGDLVTLKSESICHGMMVWNQSGKVCWVVRYPILMVISVNMLFWVSAHHYLNVGHSNWFIELSNYTVPVSGVLYSYTIFSQRKKITRVSRALDLWWHYLYLEKELEELKRNAADKIKRFNYVYHNFMLLSGISYSLLPFWRYCYDADNDSNSLLLFQCWSPFPLSTWWGFSVTYLLGLITVVSVFLMFGSIITFLIASAIVIGNQFQLIGVALTTTVERVARSMKETGVTEDQDLASIRTWFIQKELNHSVIHLQKIFSLTEEVCEFFTTPVNMCYYPGMFTLVLCCGKLATERENKALLFQVSFMSTAILVNQFTLAFVNQILTDQMENLRFSIYDSKWYLMQIPCRKTIRIIQSMVLRNPNLKTILGANADMEFFTAICHASYCYLSFLLSMNINY